MSNRQNSLWTKNFSLFFATNFFMNMGTQFLMPILPLFAMQALGADQSQVGYLLGVYSFAALLVRPISGYAYDHIGRKKTYIVALVFFTLMTFSYPFASTFFMLVLFRFLHGLSFGVTSTGGGAIVGDIVPTTRRGEGIGYFGLANTLSMALGPAIGLVILGNNQYTSLFVASGVLIGVALLMANFISYPKQHIQTKTISLSSFFEKRIVPVAGVMLMTGIIFGGVMSYIIVYSKEIGIINGGLYFFVSAGGVAVTRLFAGKILDNYGPTPVISFGFTALALGFVALFASSGLFLFLVAAFLLGLGNGVIMPTLQTMVINMVEPEARGVANSTFFAATDIGIGGGSFLLGWLSGIVSLRIMFLISGIYVILPLSFYLLYVAKDYSNKIAQLDPEYAPKHVPEHQVTHRQQIVTAE